MAPAEDEFADRLDRYLDGVVGGRPSSGAGLDPALAAAVRRVHARRAAPGPDAAFVARLEEELMHDASPTNGHAPPAFPLGRWAAVAVPPAATPQRAAGRWPLTELVVAAVVLLAIASGIGAYRDVPSGSNDDEPKFAGALGGTPSPNRAIACDPSSHLARTGSAREGGGQVGLPGTPATSLDLPTDVPPASSGNPSGLPEELLPRGTQPDDAAIAGITDAMVRYAVCTDERGLAVFSDDHFRRRESRTTLEDGSTTLLWPLPLQGVERAEDVRLRDARSLPDGRVGAVVEFPNMGPDFLGYFVAFVESDHGWLIDELVVVRRPNPQGSTPFATPTPFPFPGVPRFEPTHRVVGAEPVNLRTSPSTLLVPIVALPPGARLQNLYRESPTVYAADDDTRWRLFLVETGQMGWLREVDVEPYRG